MGCDLLVDVSINLQLFLSQCFCEKVFLGPYALHEVLISWFGHYVTLASKLGPVPEGFV